MSLAFKKSGRGSMMSPSSSAASLPPYSEASSYTLLSSRRGSEYSSVGSRYIHFDDGGVYLSSLVVTFVVSSIATIGILLCSLVIALAVMLGSCQNCPSEGIALTSSRSGSISCGGFIMNSEVNNLQGWVLPRDCVTEVKAYMTGQYFKDFSGAMDAAADYVSSLSLKGDGTEVVVMDIDETALSNLPYYVQHHYGSEIFDEDNWNQWVDREAALPFPAAVAFFKQMKAAQVNIAFLTGRPESQRNVTAANLIAAGYKDWPVLLLRSPNETGLSALEYKSQRRLLLEEEGYTVLSSIGDQWSDIQGPASGNRTFKLPNPMYYIY